MIRILLLTLYTGLLASSAALAGNKGMKSLFLNGVDISSARNQSLQNVDVMINEAGDIFLTAPQYQVNEEDTYIPLSKYSQGLGVPTHKSPQAIPGSTKKSASGQNPTPQGEPSGAREEGSTKPTPSLPAKTKGAAPKGEASPAATTDSPGASAKDGPDGTIGTKEPDEGDGAEASSLTSGESQG